MFDEGKHNTIDGFYYGHIIAMVLVVVAVCLHAVARSHAPRCRLLVVPNHGNSLCLRLWCLHHMLMAQVRSMPLELARTLAPVGQFAPDDVACANALDQDRLWQQIEDSAGGHRGLDKLNRNLQRLSQRNKRRFYMIALGWAFFWAWLRLADLHLAVSHSRRLDSASLMYCSIGLIAGALASAMLACKMAISAHGLLTMQRIFKNAALLLVCGWVTIVTPSYWGLLGQTDWDQPSEILFDEAYRHLNMNACISSGCRSGVAMLSTSGQTMMIGALNLIFFSLVVSGFLNLPRRWFCPQKCYLHVVLLALGLAVIITIRLAIDGSPREPDKFAVLLHYMTPALARCVVPLWALRSVSSSWGLRVNGPDMRCLRRGSGQSGGYKKTLNAFCI